MNGSYAMTYATFHIVYNAFKFLQKIFDMPNLKVTGGVLVKQSLVVRNAQKTK